MYDHYEVNVALNGKHFFATAPRSATDHAAAKELTQQLKARFPEAEGYSVTCTHWQCVGKPTSF